MFSTKGESYAFLAILIVVIVVSSATTITWVILFRNRNRLSDNAPPTDKDNTIGRYWPFERTPKSDVENATPRISPGQISEPSDVRRLNLEERLVVESSDKETYAQAQRTEADKTRSLRVFGVVDGRRETTSLAVDCIANRPILTQEKMLLLNLAFISAPAGSCSNLSSSHTATITAPKIRDPPATNDTLPEKVRNERFHARDITSLVFGSSIPSFTSPNQDATTSAMSTTSWTLSATPSVTSTPLPEISYEHHSDGSAITLAILVSIIGGALLLTLAGWAWRKQKNKKSFGPDHHGTELAKLKILNAGSAPSGARRHYNRDTVELDARPY
ncbi:hypothetical protein P171DRAFT_439542 [Karstenula rhodostoma CBS 690.94]|uniref:Uncharacterized protein n=1 Tax=Karstenula rhodostoma CBS 690.94 TaxID=1392251 RepID=A0A9P4PY54_9PLEO|nr:hypothetical protein P171DRAFT_439542 [Karstenula rhodostoma CBS 690.94]